MGFMMIRTERIESSEALSQGAELPRESLGGEGLCLQGQILLSI